jgi:hypothetical protein
MNKRIGELAEQAALLGPGSRIGNAHGATERFAELIIRECLSICEELGDKGMDGHYCADKILKHFGVDQ